MSTETADQIRAQIAHLKLRLQQCLLEEEGTGAGGNDANNEEGLALPLHVDPAGSCPSSAAALFRDFLEYGTVGLHVVDNTGKIMWANKAELELLGYSKEEYIGHSIADFHVDKTKIDEILGLLLAGKKVVNFEAPLRCKDGHVEYVEINSSMREQSGKLVTTRCFSACVTDKLYREQMEARRIEHELMLRNQEKTLEVQRLTETQFLRSLCHELRNPLSGVRGNLELQLQQLDALTSMMNIACPEPARLLTRVKSHLEDMKEFATAAAIAADHQALLLNETLTLATLGARQLAPQTVDLAVVAREVVAIVEVAAHVKGVAIHVELPDEARFVKTDLGWARLLLMNLLTNATKFTETGRIDVAFSIRPAIATATASSTVAAAAIAATTAATATASGTGSNSNSDDKVIVGLSVRDTGIGMTPEEIGRLFAAFAQANADISRKFGGSGLGLHIVREYLDHIGGTIGVTSNKGVGTTFSVTLPCGTVTEEEQRELSTRRLYEKKRDAEERAAAAAAVTASAETGGSVAAHILLVEDNAINQKLLTRFCTRGGHNYTLATDGVAAVEAFCRRHFDLVFMDVQMPRMDGNLATHHIRRGGFPPTSGCPSSACRPTP